MKSTAQRTRTAIKKWIILASAAMWLLLICQAIAQPLSHVANPIPGAKSHFTRFDATNKIHYLLVGRGTQTVVFIHGWSANSGFWREQVPALADKAKLILVDLPGHGRSDKPHTDYTMDYLARGVLAVMRDARVRKATLIGHSMGVPVMCRVHAQAPDKITGLVAVDGLLRRSQFKPEEVEKYLAPYRMPDFSGHVTNFLNSMFPDVSSHPLRDRVLAEVMATPPYVMSSAMHGMFATNQPPWDMHDVKVPVLVLNAPNPRWNAEYEAYARALSPKTDYRVLEGTGHCLMLEKPAEFNAALLAMLQEFDLVKK
jgi:pimeloyl-ACP methyl ester carboxylesterase